MRSRSVAQRNGARAACGSRAARSQKSSRIIRNDLRLGCRVSVDSKRVRSPGQHPMAQVILFKRKVLAVAVDRVKWVLSRI